MSNSGGRFAPYRNALTAISGRTGAPLPSLIVSFAILHELTAIVPIVGIFYTARSVGAGERVVNAIALSQDSSTDDQSWVNTKLRLWVDEGEQWAGRIGCRYGILGFEKGQFVDQSRTSQLGGSKLAGDVANAVLAYGAVKALLPIRIGLSLYLSPMFSRTVVEPIRLGGLRLLGRGPKFK
ncbi:hypothetical protein DEU56DRAFT_504483 [Suillus clintonianus]|uniref:uncharacterized protein n=1 Tax=Suillus clintonianus TaxID=1904413 RepID=UPI001B86A6C7|nr:uncharacterized protein DEU56DRAFT_504483 [Suillus clintonianus]KAG2128697.1 hypothetical protein DEU56DRAFT_504483 [Suillus clintonianus]